MSAVFFEGTTTNTEILAVANRVFTVVRLSMERASEAVHKSQRTTVPSKGIEKNTYDLMKQLQVTDRSLLKKFSGLTRTSTGHINPWLDKKGHKVFTPDFSSDKTVMEQAFQNNLFKDLKFSRSTIMKTKYDSKNQNYNVPVKREQFANQLLNTIGVKLLAGSSLSGAVDKTNSSTKKVRELHLKLASLKAIRRYGWEVSDWGDDSICAGGNGLDGSQHHIEVPSFFINTFTRDGQNFNIHPDKTFVKFDLTRNGTWPRAFISNVFISEKDAEGGFVEFLLRLWDAIGEQVIELATTLSVAAAGGVLGGVIGTEFLPVIGTIIGAVVGAVTAMVVKWFINSMTDDIFSTPENPVGIMLESPEVRFAGNSLKSSNYTIDFTLNQARYILTYYWQLVE